MPWPQKIVIIILLAINTITFLSYRNTKEQNIKLEDKIKSLENLLKADYTNEVL